MLFSLLAASFMKISIEVTPLNKFQSYPELINIFKIMTIIYPSGKEIKNVTQYKFEIRRNKCMMQEH